MFKLLLKFYIYKREEHIYYNHIVQKVHQEVL